MTGQTLPGPFSAAQLNSGVWLLTRETSDPVRVYLRGAEPAAAALLAVGVPIAGLELEWRPDGVDVGVTAEGGVRHFHSADAFIHESKPRLYESLPLAVFDPAARRFWRRVFRVIRIPGGGMLLGVIARRGRHRRGRPGTASH